MQRRQRTRHSAGLQKPKIRRNHQFDGTGECERSAGDGQDPLPTANRRGAVQRITDVLSKSAKSRRLAGEGEAAVGEAA